MKHTLRLRNYYRGEVLMFIIVECVDCVLDLFPFFDRKRDKRNDG